MKRQESVVEEVTRKMKDITKQPPVERQEVAYMLGQILGMLNSASRSCDIPQEKLDELTDSISKFSLKGIKKDEVALH